MFKPVYNLLHRHYHSRYHGVYRHAKKLFVFDLCLLGLAAVMLGASVFFFFWRPGTTNLIDLSLSIGNGRAMSGEKIILNIEYVNRSKYILRDAALALRLPGGFIILDKNKNTVFKIGEIAPGSKGELNIAGQLWSNMKTDEKIVAALTYTAGENKFNEQKLAAMLLNLPGSALTTVAEWPESSFANSHLPIVITLKNNGVEKIDNIMLTHNWPGDITLDKETKNIFLEAGAETTLKGFLITPDKNGAVPLQITTHVIVNNRPLAQSVVEKNVRVTAPQFSSKAEISGAAFAEPGSALSLNIFFKNNNSFSTQNTKIRLAMTPGVVDLAATAQENRLKTEGGDLIIDKTSRTLLGNTPAGQGENFNITLRLRPHFSLAEGVRALRVEPIIEAQLPELPEQKFTKAGLSASIPLATEVSFSISPVYYTEDGEQLGRGPLPPTVGETTRYFIIVNYANTINNVKNISFRATLPPGVEMGTRKSVTIGPLMRYDPTDRSITWNFNEIPSWSQGGLYFDVAVSPSSAQIGQNLTLLKNVRFSATDKISEKQFNFSYPAIYNILKPNDSGAAKGATVTAP